MWNEKRKVPKVGSLAFYNLKEGRTFCEWGSDGQDTLEGILKECKLPCEEMVEVEVITPEECAWEIFGEQEG